MSWTKQPWEEVSSLDDATRAPRFFSHSLPACAYLGFLANDKICLFLQCFTWLWEVWWHNALQRGPLSETERGKTCNTMFTISPSHKMDHDIKDVCFHLFVFCCCCESVLFGQPPPHFHSSILWSGQPPEGWLFDQKTRKSHEKNSRHLLMAKSEGGGGTKCLIRSMF